ncbi:MAG: Ldh family oxidoreductase [Alphaproteobacteria bacterium]|nr:Ldh family oxidoreductase [Alphaproteobacteria bacterium]
MTSAKTMTIGDIEAVALNALLAAGASEANALPLARAVAAAERDGIASHGLAYVPTYCQHVQCGKVDGQAEPVLDRPKPASLVVDAKTGFAHPAIALGFEALIDTAREQGLAGLAVRNSYNCGVLGYHTEQIAAAGLLGIGFTNAPASIAPVNGRTPVIGTNPISLAVPDGAGGAAILIDQSASVVAKSEIMKHAREERPIPEGWALDPDGHPTTDPALGLKGSMAPTGGYKGVGIALIVETMAAALAGATLGIHASPFSGTAGGAPKTGQFFLAIDAQAFSGGSFDKRIADLVAAITDQPGVHLQGQGRKAARKKADREGVMVATKTLEAIEAGL